VKELLALRVTAGTSCAAVRARAAAKAADVKRQVADLDRIKAALESLMAVCPGRGALVNCSILGALDSAKVDVPRTRLPARKRGAKGVLSMKSLEMKIGGMQCDGCASTIQSILSREPGVKSSSVSFPKHAASVFFDPKETDAGRLAEAVTKAGFSVESRQ
jgi:copper chaperone CopZ